MADNTNEITYTNPIIAKYITPEDFQELLDNNTVQQDCVYIVYYEADTLPTGLTTEPILEVFIGSNRVSSIINLDSISPNLVYDDKYINADILKERVADDIMLSDDKEELAERITATILELSNADFTNNSYSHLPSNLGVSNKLYLHFDASSGKYEMYILHPQLRKLIPLKLIPDSGTPAPTPTPTPTTTKLILEYSAIIDTPQLSNLSFVSQQYVYDLQHSTSIQFGKPGSNIFVQGKMAFWSFSSIDEYIAIQSNTRNFITYNNCDINFTLTSNNTAYNTSFVSDFDTLEYVTYTDSDGYEYTDFFVKTTNKYYDSNDNEISALSKDCWVKPRSTGWSQSGTAMYGYGAYGLTIIANSIKAPNVDPTNFPFGYITGRIYNTITAERGCTDLDDYINKITGDTTVIFDSFIEAKIPFANINEYYFATAITTKSEVVIDNG